MGLARTLFASGERSVNPVHGYLLIYGAFEHMMALPLRRAWVVICRRPFG